MFVNKFLHHLQFHVHVYTTYSCQNHELWLTLVRVIWKYFFAYQELISFRFHESIQQDLFTVDIEMVYL